VRALFLLLLLTGQYRLSMFAEQVDLNEREFTVIAKNFTKNLKILKKVDLKSGNGEDAIDFMTKLRKDQPLSILL
jgi:hypothetical protein